MYLLGQFRRYPPLTSMFLKYLKQHSVFLKFIHWVLTQDMINTDDPVLRVTKVA